MDKILITGAFGLVGSDLIPELIKRNGESSIVALAYFTNPYEENITTEIADIRDAEALTRIVEKYSIKTIYHLAGLLSFGSENEPDKAFEVNLGGLKNVLDVARDYSCKVFWPSSIAAFGPTTPKEQVPQRTVLEPTTMYGQNKVAGELLCQYYHLKYGVDVRSLRYPGLLGWKSTPGNGTTEYSLWMMYAAIKQQAYECPLKPDTALPMMHMSDAIRGTLQLMDAKLEALTVRTSYNFSATSFCPAELIVEIKKRYPDLKVTFVPDERQKIADSWPKTIDDTQARSDWGWKPTMGLSEMVADLLLHIKEKLRVA